MTNQSGSILVTDTTECPLQHPSNQSLQQILYSGYKKCTTFKYEVTLDLANGLPLFVSGPYAGPTADITVFWSHLKGVMITNGMIGLADGSYQGEGALLLVPP